MGRPHRVGMLQAIEADHCVGPDDVRRITLPFGTTSR